jgi:hypothetical protein
MLPGIPTNQQLQQIATLPDHARLSASCTSRLNMVTSVHQDSGLVPSKHFRCRVLERNNFRKASSDLPKVIE